LNKNTSSRVITQPNIIRPERNSNLNCNSSRYSHIPNIKSIYQRRSRKIPDNLKFEQKIQVQGSLLNLYFLFKFEVVRTFLWRPLIYWLDIWHVAISRWVTVPNIKSIYQRTSRKSPDNLKFEQKYKFKGHNSAKYHSTGTKFELKL
jgi:hypothetical protein